MHSCRKTSLTSIVRAKEHLKITNDLVVRLHKVATLATQNFRLTLLQGHVSLTQKLFLEHVKGVDSVDKKYLSSGPLKYFWTNYKRVFENNIWMHYGNRLVKHARNTFNIIKKEAVQEVNLWINGQCTLINEQERQKLVPITPANEKTIKSNTDKFFQAHLYLAKLWPHFQAIPFTMRLVPGYITIDTSLLNVVFRLKSKSITEHRFDIWNTVFNLNDRVFLKSKHGFSWMLQTDGVGASILFMRKECVERHEAKKNPGPMHVTVSQKLSCHQKLISRQLFLMIIIPVKKVI